MGPVTRRSHPGPTEQEGGAMPAFDTPGPLTVHLSLGFVVANVRITAEDRTDATVDVRPADPSNKADLKVADQTRVEFTDGRVHVRAPRLGMFVGRTGTIDVTVEVPEGSDLRGETGMGEVLCEGRLRECRFKTGYGEIRLDRVGTVDVTSASGDVTVDHADTVTGVKASNGAISIRRVDGSATVRNSNGATWIGEVGGDLRVNASNGSIAVDRAGGDVTAKTANGAVRIGEVTRGEVVLSSAAGPLEVGVPEGTAAWLDLKTFSGRVRNELSAAAGPGDAADTVQVRARTYLGDIVVRRP
jgi:DUF4097 and DUF4098 domain-containing protein YvlB